MMMIKAIVALSTSLAAVQGFTRASISDRSIRSTISTNSQRSNIQPPMMVATAKDMFGDELPDDMNLNNKGVEGQSVKQEDSASKKYVSGDDLHRLRHEVLAMRLELQEARRSGSKRKVKQLEAAIMKAQQVDAEFVYTVSMERKEIAEEQGLFQDAEKFDQQAKEARSALPQFNLEGLWVGKYGDHGYEMINVTYVGDTLIASKVTGTKNVPKGQATFQVDLNPADLSSDEEVLEPIELGDSAAKQWGCKYLQRFSGQGQVAADGYQDSQWIDGQLIMVNEYFSFAWLPIGHQVFFGRPTAELVLKLLKDDKKNDNGGCTDRSFLEKCWEETEHMEDHLEVDEGCSLEANTQQDFYHQDGCFE